MSSALQQRKRAEAEDLLKQADKCLSRKSLFRVNPDYLSAAPLLEKAGEAFRSAGALDEAKRAFTQAAGVQQKNNASFRAAQAYENVAKLALQQLKAERTPGTRLDEVRRAYEAACGQYGDMGELGKAADALLKAGAAFEENGGSDEDARALYMRACSLLEAQDKPHFAVDAFRKTLGFLAKRALYAEGIALLDRMIAIFEQIDQPANKHKCFLSQAVLQLALGDVPAADQKYMAHLQDDAYLSSDECAAEEDLVRAFKMGDEPLLQTTIRKTVFSFLDNQVGRTARQLSIYGSSSGASAGSSNVNAARTGSRTDSRTGSGSNQRNPFAPAAATKSRNPFAPENRPRPAPVPAAPVSAPAPPVVAAVAAPPPAPISAPISPPEEMETDYAAAAAAATGGVDDMEAIATGIEDMNVRATSTDFNFDALEFAMPDSDELEFKMPDEPAHEFDNAPASQQAAPASTVAAQPPQPHSQQYQQQPPVNDDDFFDLT